ncbi:MAG: CehA/McbA family metallohydrolase [Chloroflexota bacterium]
MARRWFKGNLHTHTSNSDGDSPPADVVAWYRDAGYDFLALTDHDVVTLPGDRHDVAGSMTLIHGQELTAGDIHMNALGARRTVEPTRAPTERLTLQANADSVRAAGGIPSINHPNFHWAVRPTDIEQVTGVHLFEVFNAGPETNDFGGRPGHPSTEELWDGLLALGKRMTAIAVDDAHDFRTWGHRCRNPGRAWVHVHAKSASQPDILEALDAGASYASTGVEAQAIEVRANGMAIDIATEWDRAYRTSFIGRGGTLLDVVDGPEPRYRFKGSEGYVRARIDDSDGHTAWLQAHFLD